VLATVHVGRAHFLAPFAEEGCVLISFKAARKKKSSVEKKIFSNRARLVPIKEHLAQGHVKVQTNGVDNLVQALLLVREENLCLPKLLENLCHARLFGHVDQLKEKKKYMRP